MSLRVALRHRFPGITLDLAFDAPVPGVVALFGPSGSGKTSVVQAVAGLFRPEHCQVQVNGAVLADTAHGVWAPPERRRLGVVFQDARLFPHMTVARNLRYGLRRAPPAAPGEAVRFDDVVALLGIGALLARRPHTLSGGERQRVAIGRALLAQPRLLLMDEPLASLDAPRRAEILPYLARLKTALGLPVLYVTHAMDEVARLADTVVLLEAGAVTAVGPLTDLAARGDLALSRRDDAGAVLLATIAAHDPARHLTRVAAAGMSLLVPLLPMPVGAALRLRVPAREVALARSVPQGISMQNAVRGTVRGVTVDGADHAALVEVAAGSGALLARVTKDAVARLELRPGAEVVALFKSVGVDVLLPGAA